jgi:translation initiation factor 2B subunit (eIF-2B alpha/beta/delta family)
MPLFQDHIRRIVERLAQMRSRNAATFENSAAHVTQALEDVTEAVKNIEQRLQQVERGAPSKSPSATSAGHH